MTAHTALGFFWPMDAQEQFVRQLTGSQRGLYAFIVTLLSDRHAAQDVLQNVNVVIWRKADQFTPGTDFMRWACRIAKLEVLSHLRQTSRDQHLFDQQLIEELAEGAARYSLQAEERAAALEDCLSVLPASLRAMILERYAPGGSLETLAAQRNTTSGTIAVALYRARQALRACIERKLAAEGRA